MRHISHIDRIAEAIADYRLCLFYIKAPDCGVCYVMLDKVGRMAEHHPLLDAFYTCRSVPGLFRSNCITPA